VVPEDLQVPGYDIEERIGRGGMASVYRARQHTFDRDVALKVLKPDLSEDESFCQRFVQESLIVAKLHHSNIVQVYDVGEFQNNFYIAMEYLNGGDLNSRLKQGLAIRETINIIKQSASALDFAHRKNIIHRDIKPDNIMFREDGAAVITDFGIAKEVDSDLNLTQTGLIVGTPKYMAPEQIRGGSPTPQADIYSLGILLFQCLTDQLPFVGKDMVSTAYKHFNDPVPTLPPVIAVFQPILERMLAKDPDDRYERAAEIVEALDELTGDTEQNQLTNLDITKDFVPPESDMDPTLVHFHNQETGETASIADDVTVVATTKTPAKATPAKPKTKATENEPERTADNSNHAKPLVPIAATVAVVCIGAAGYFMLNSGGDAVDKPQPQAVITATKEQHQSAGEITVKRLLDEAQTDIAAKRLKRPASNNAFDKLLRVLELDPGNAQALSSLEKIAEEYAKLAEQALTARNHIIAASYLEHARSASPSLAVVNAIQTKLAAARKTENKNQQTIASLEKSLMIDGLMSSAAIDEDEGRLASPSGDNALEKYQKVLQLDPTHLQARTKLDRITSL